MYSVFEPVTREDLKRAHDAAFVDGVLDLSIDNGFGNRNAQVAASLPYTSGSLLAAARHALAHRENVCSPTSGFHHAGYDSAQGFCTFNGLMVTALALLEADLEADNSWYVPLLPAAEGHALDAWSFSLKLNPEEWEALRPIARVLTSRCLLTSYTSTTEQITCEGVPWDPCRLQLAAMAGVKPSELRAGFRASEATRPLREAKAPVTLQMMHGLVDL